MNWKTWLYSLVAGGIGGGANAVLGAIVMPDVFNFSHDGWVHLGKLALIGALVPVCTLLKQSPLPSFTSVTTVTKTLSMFMLCAVLSLSLSGCPNLATRQTAAQAAHNAEIIVSGFQQSEIVAHNQGLIPDTDHAFIQHSLLTIAQTGVTADKCISSASDNTGIIVCVNTVVSEIDTLNAQGVLALKSDKAKTDFNLAMIGTKTALTVITTMLGGN